MSKEKSEQDSVVHDAVIEAAERLQNHLQYVLFTDTSPASYAALADWNLIYGAIVSDET